MPLWATKDRTQAESMELYEVFPRIALIVQCTNFNTRIKHPVRKPFVQVDPNTENARGWRFEEVVKQIKEVIPTGRDVLMHCEKSVHRGPIIAPGIMRRLSGVNVEDAGRTMHQLCSCSMV